MPVPLSARSQSHALPVWSPSEDFFCLDSRRDLKNLTTERQSFSGPKKTTLLPVESGVISIESEYLCMGNGCFKLLSTTIMSRSDMKKVPSPLLADVVESVITVHSPYN